MPRRTGKNLSITEEAAFALQGFQAGVEVANKERIAYAEIILFLIWLVLDKPERLSLTELPSFGARLGKSYNQFKEVLLRSRQIGTL